MKKIKCRECGDMKAGIYNGFRNIFYCMHPESKTECLPHNIITRSRSVEIPTKTAPKWCPRNNPKNPPGKEPEPC